MTEPSEQREQPQQDLNFDEAGRITITNPYLVRKINEAIKTYARTGKITFNIRDSIVTGAGQDSEKVTVEIRPWPIECGTPIPPDSPRSNRAPSRSFLLPRVPAGEAP